MAKTPAPVASSRQRLLDAALHEFRSRGYAATTVDDLCRAAGVGRDVTARDREWATRLEVVRSMNKALTEHVRDLDRDTADYRDLPRG